MQSLKKYALFVLLAVFVASFGVASVHAQSAALTANVPFDFVAGKTNMTAGSYWVKTDGAFVAFSKVGGTTTYALLSQAGDAAKRDGQPYLVFTRYGTESFLNKIVFSSDQSYDLPRSNREKEIMAHVPTGEQVAVLFESAR
jgi:hypothetical protein